MTKHYTADIDAMGTAEPADAYRATIQLSEHVQIVATDESPFWVMCEVLKSMRALGVKGTVEGFYNGESVLDPIAGNGLEIK